MSESVSANVDSLAARVKDVEIDNSTKTLSRSVLGKVPDVTVEGPKKVDTFECDENAGNRPISFDGVSVPYFLEELRGRKALNFDLLHNFNTFVRKDHSALELGERVLWLEEKLKARPGVSLKEVLENADFFTSRGVLKLMGTAPFSAFPWNIVAFKYHGQEVQTDFKSRQGDYMGHKFEQYVTSDSLTGQPDTSKPINTYKKHMIMLQSSFECEGKRLSCLFSSEMDAVGSDGHAIELKTEVDNLRPSEKLAMKYASWWMQCKLAAVPEIVVGVKPNIYRQSSTTVKAVKSIALDELPRLANGHLYWKPEKLVYYLHLFLAEVKSTLDNAPEGALLVAELTSGEARSIAIHLEKQGESDFDFFYKKLDERISKYL